MIITQLTGAMGNQMFQYAMGRAVAQRLGVPFKLDTTVYNTHKKRHYALDTWNITAEKATWFEIAKLKYLPGGKVLKEKRLEFCPEMYTLPDNTYIENYNQVWQSEKYFKDIETTIREEFTLKFPLPEKLKDVATQINNSNSVSVHIRRTDYLTKQNTYVILGKEYYSQAIDIINQKIVNPVFFFFSDDIEWVKNNIPYPENSVFLSNEDYYDLALMSTCKHHINANSTFSWWGAWLSQDPEKIVIAPKQWFNKTEMKTDDIMPGTWIQI